MQFPKSLRIRGRSTRALVNVHLALTHVGKSAQVLCTFLSCAYRRRERIDAYETIFLGDDVMLKAREEAKASPPGDSTITEKSAYLADACSPSTGSRVMQGQHVELLTVLGCWALNLSLLSKQAAEIIRFPPFDNLFRTMNVGICFFCDTKKNVRMLWISSPNLFNEQSQLSIACVRMESNPIVIRQALLVPDFNNCTT